MRVIPTLALIATLWMGPPIYAQSSVVSPAGTDGVLDKIFYSRPDKEFVEKRIQQFLDTKRGSYKDPAKIVIRTLYNTEKVKRTTRNGVTFDSGTARFVGYLYHTDAADPRQRSWVQLFKGTRDEKDADIKIVNAYDYCSSVSVGSIEQARLTGTHDGLIWPAQMELLQNVHRVGYDLRLHIGANCVQEEWGKWHYTTKLRLANGKTYTTYLTTK